MERKDQTDLLIVAHSGEMSGGAEIALLEMIRYLKECRVNMHIISPYDGDFSKEVRALDIPLTHIPQPWWVLGLADEHDFRFINNTPGENVTAQIVHLIESINPKVCVSNTMAVPWLAYASAICGIPHGWFIHEVGLDFKYALGRDETLKTIDNLSDKIFCNSQYTADQFRSYFTHNTEIDIVYPLSKFKKPDPKTASPFTLKKNRFILTGALIHRKAQLDAIEAIRKLRDRNIEAELVLVGNTIDTGYVQLLHEYCSEHNLDDRVHFLGVQENPNSFVQHADVVLMCSEAEAFGLVTVEGMLLGKPVIGASNAGTLEIIKDGENGLLYKLHDTEDLSIKMETLVQDPALLKRIGETAQKTTASRFSPKNSYQPLLAFIQDTQKRQSINLVPLRSIMADYDLLNESLHVVEKERDAAVASLTRIHNTFIWKSVAFSKRIIKKLHR